jgi:hypothetical protein
VSSWVGPDETPQARHELGLGQARRGRAPDTASAPVLLVVLTDASLQVLTHGAGTDEDEVVLRRQAQRDLIDEPLEVLESMRFSGGLGPTATAVPDGRIVADMAGGSMVGRDFRFDSFESARVLQPADDDGLSRIDPDEGHRGSGDRSVPSALSREGARLWSIECCWSLHGVLPSCSFVCQQGARGTQWAHRPLDAAGGAERPDRRGDPRGVASLDRAGRHLGG